MFCDPPDIGQLECEVLRLTSHRYHTMTVPRKLGLRHVLTIHILATIFISPYIIADECNA